jgi:hypothetical protein
MGLFVRSTKSPETQIPETRKHKRVRTFEKKEIEERVKDENYSRKAETRRLQKKATRKFLKPELMETVELNTVTGDSTVIKPEIPETEIEHTMIKTGRDTEVGHINFRKSTRRVKRTDLVSRKDPITKQITRSKITKRKDEYYDEDGKLHKF